LLKLFGIKRNYFIDTLVKNYNIPSNTDFDIFLESTEAKQYLVDILISQSENIPVYIDTLLKSLSSEDINLDTLISKFNRQYLSIDAVISLTKSERIFFDTLSKRLDIPTGMLLDTYLSSPGIYTIDYNIDTFLIDNDISLDIAYDVILKLIKSHNIKYDMCLRKSNLHTTFIQSILLTLSNLTLSNIIDAYIQSTLEVDYDIDTILKSQIESEYALDSLLHKVTSISYLLTTRVSNIYSPEYLLDTLLKKYIVYTYNLDSILYQRDIRESYGMDIRLHALIWITYAKQTPSSLFDMSISYEAAN